MDQSSILDLTGVAHSSEPVGRSPRNVTMLARRIAVAVVLAATVTAAVSGCSGSDSESAAIPAPTPTATPLPINFEWFFEADLPKVDEATWYEVTDTPAHWPSLVSLPETLHMDDGSFVESTRTDGTRVLTGRFFFDPNDDYVGDLRQRLMEAGFVSVDFFENRVGLNDTLLYGESQVVITSTVFGYAIVDVIE